MKNFKKVLACILLSLCMTMVVSSDLPGLNVVSTVEAASRVKINKTKASLVKGKTLQLKISGTSKKIKWSSSKKSVATVSSKGKVTAKKKGTATITAKVGSKKYTCKITVKEPTPKLSKTSLTLKVGQSSTLKLTGTSSKIKWSSSKKSVATVSSKGKVTAKKKGTATITAKVGSKKYTCKVTVKAAPASTPAPTPTPVPTPTPDPTPTPVPTPTPDPVPSEPTIADNYKALKNYILTYGSVNSSGNKFIKLNKNYQSDTYSWGIVYELAADKLNFIYTSNTINPKTQSSLNMYVDLQNSNIVTPKFTFVMYSPQIGFQTTAQIVASNYTGNQDIYFSIIQTIGSASSSSIQKICNSDLQLAFVGWEELLAGKTGLTLKKLGFLAYSAN